MNVIELLKKASVGEITQNEIENVYHALVNPNAKEDKYDLLLILGRAQAKQYVTIVEQYLNSPNDPMLARLALQILCRYWGLAKKYEGVLLQFIKGIDWDEDEDVRIMAISCASEILKSESNKQLLSVIYNIFKSLDEDEINRGAAYEVLAISAGISILDLKQSVHFDINKDVDFKVIEQVEKNLDDQIK